MTQQKSVPNEAIAIRLHKKSDEPFIYATWLKSYKASSYFAKRISNAVYYKKHAEIISHILEKPTSKTFIAHPIDDTDTICGYLTCEPGKVSTAHFVYVKEAFRNMGIARALFLAADVIPDYLIFTHWSYPMDEFVQKYENMIYDPYAL